MSRYFSGDNNNNPGVVEQRATRLKLLRNMTSMTREEYCEHVGTNRHTYAGWESARFGGLSLSGAEAIINALPRFTDIICSVSWLMDGEGTGPIILPPDKEFSNITSSTVSQEISLLKALYKDVLIMKVNDDSMLPTLDSGDIVAGINRLATEKKYIDKACIIKLNNNKQLIRKIIKDKSSGKLSLLATNLESNTDDLMLHNPEIIEVAPISWIRKIKNQF